mmetsp:Transcript_3706/g.9288  ORF Transcript_3706/g.9288 Transcript_3706/m.9288 type:complete len:179 (+) Transcript_3706:158-694(+)
MPPMMVTHGPTMQGMNVCVAQMAVSGDTGRGKEEGAPLGGSALHQSRRDVHIATRMVDRRLDAARVCSSHSRGPTTPTTHAGLSSGSSDHCVHRFSVVVVVVDREHAEGLVHVVAVARGGLKVLELMLLGKRIGSLGRDYPLLLEVDLGRHQDAANRMSGAKLSVFLEPVSKVGKRGF